MVFNFHRYITREALTKVGETGLTEEHIVCSVVCANNYIKAGRLTALWLYCYYSNNIMFIHYLPRIRCIKRLNQDPGYWMHPAALFRAGRSICYQLYYQA